MDKIKHVSPTVVEITGNRVIIPKPIYKELVTTVNTLVDIVNLLATNQANTDARINEVKLEVQALASSIRSL